MSQIDSIIALAATLPAGPWQAFGSYVYINGWPALTAHGGDAGVIARAVAGLPDAVRVLIAAHPDAMAARIEELEREVETLKARIGK